MFEDQIQKLVLAILVPFFVSIVVNRGLHVLFDWRVYKAKLDGKGWKAPISFATSFVICVFGDLDVLTYVLDARMYGIGIVLTALMVSGGASLWVKVLGDIKQGVDAAQKK